MAAVRVAKKSRHVENITKEKPTPEVTIHIKLILLCAEFSQIPTRDLGQAEVKGHIPMNNNTKEINKLHKFVYANESMCWCES